MVVNIGYTNAAGQNVVQTLFTDSADIVQGQNYAMNIQVTFNPDGEGTLVVVRNEITIVNYTGPLGWADQTGVYWKEGIYKTVSPETVTVDYSNLAISTGAPTTAPLATGPVTYDEYNAAGQVVASVTTDPNGILDYKFLQ